ncbi:MULTISPECIES: hypothetical protein [unclassified Paraburkholderia]|uniref:hypothetical protein n=1 Tax=unclassified Paraburkholderia TaxID=2615204 RepID=UPI002AB29AC7|nr:MULTISPECIES: hypothetical protein [unclassified Paraburkholderia]
MWIKTLRESNWKYDTGAGGGGGIDVVLASGGVVVLDPPTGQPEQFAYAGVGMGITFPILKWLKLGKLELPKLNVQGRSVGASGATKGFDSSGKVYMTEAFRGTELEIRNFEGGVIYVDWSLGYLAGWSGTFMLAGIDPRLMKLATVPVAGAAFMRQAIMSAPVFIRTVGRMEGLTDSLGGGIMFGQLTYQSPEPAPKQGPVCEVPGVN